MKAVLIYSLLSALPLGAANAFFVTFPVQAPAGATGQDAQAALSAGVTLLRHQIPGEPAYQMSGPDGPGVGRIFTRPGTGSYVLTDVGSQWVTAVGQGQTILGVTETYAGQFLWTDKPYAGAVQGSVGKPDIAAGHMSLGPVLMSGIPAPLLGQSSEERLDLQVPPFVDASGLAMGLVLWRQPDGQAWEKWADLPLSGGTQAFADLSVTAQASYRYGLSIRYAWPGGGQAGALPMESGSYVTVAKSDSGLLRASLEQPTPTPFPTLSTSQTPDLGAEAWVAYPNPSRDGKIRLAFRMVKKGSFRLAAYSLDGTLVHHMEGKAEADTWPKPMVDLSRMASGIYLLQLKLRYQGESEIQLPIRKLALIR